METSATNYPKGLSVKEKKALNRLKLGLFAITLIFVIHSIPGRFFMEAFPITRWAMFSEPQNYPPELIRLIEVNIVDPNGENILTSVEDLYLPLTGNGTMLGSKIVTIAVESEDVVKQAHYQKSVIELIKMRYGFEPREVSVYSAIYRIDISLLDQIDYSQPVERQLLGTFTPDESIQE